LAQTLEETIVSLLLASLGCESEGALIELGARPELGEDEATHVVIDVLDVPVRQKHQVCLLGVDAGHPSVPEGAAADQECQRLTP
jgi:hypothetical protein